MTDRCFNLFTVETLVFMVAGVAVGVCVFDSVAAAVFLSIFAVLMKNTFFYVQLIEKELNLLLKQMDCLIESQQNNKKDKEW